MRVRLEYGLFILFMAKRRVGQFANMSFAFFRSFVRFYESSLPSCFLSNSLDRPRDFARRLLT